MNSDLDQGIEKNLDAALIQNKMHDNVKYSVKSGVITPAGEVNSQDKRTRVERVATSVPNVQQVVNNSRSRIRKPVQHNRNCGSDRCLGTEGDRRTRARVQTSSRSLAAGRFMGEDKVQQPKEEAL